ncbi:MAG: GYD domain-containing protein [Acidobacteria bacterium]|nr:GYD domain-containing protein [Acidobacteriota bacterium]
MATFILLTKLSPEVLEKPKERAKKGKEWLKKVKKVCPDVKWIAHYSILGPYDFMDIYEADSVETAHKVSLISRTYGAVSAESWEALPYEKYLKVLGATFNK